MYRDLNPLLHSQLRLAVMSVLIGIEEVEFTYLKEKTGATAGNLSLQLGKLEEAGYIKIIKGFKRKYPVTKCHITESGKKAFCEYATVIKSYLQHL
jgi:DNA-binding MarR family transcriptional regulator